MQTVEFDEQLAREPLLELTHHALSQRGKFGQSHRLYAAGLETVRQTELRATLLVNRAVLWARTKNWETSLRDAEEAKELRPTWAHAHQCYAAALEVCHLCTYESRSGGRARAGQSAAKK